MKSPGCGCGLVYECVDVRAGIEDEYNIQCPQPHSERPLELLTTAYGLIFTFDFELQYNRSIARYIQGL